MVNWQQKEQDGVNVCGPMHPSGCEMKWTTNQEITERFRHGLPCTPYRRSMDARSCVLEKSCSISWCATGARVAWRWQKCVWVCQLCIVTGAIFTLNPIWLPVNTGKWGGGNLLMIMTLCWKLFVLVDVLQMTSVCSYFIVTYVYSGYHIFTVNKR